VALESVYGNININADLSTSGWLSLASGGNINITDAVASAAQSVTAVGYALGASLNVIANSLPAALVAGTSMVVSMPGNVTVRGGSAANASAEIMWATGGSFVNKESGPWHVTAGGNIVVAGGSGSGAYATIFGAPDVAMQLTSATGEIRIDEGTGIGASAKIEADSRESIHVYFTNRTDGGYLVNGSSALSAGTSGFFAGGSPVGPNDGFYVDYGNGNSLYELLQANAPLQQTFNYIIGTTTQSTDAVNPSNTEQGNAGTVGGQGGKEKEKAKPKVCR
jgi:hypothetical protein